MKKLSLLLLVLSLGLLPFSAHAIYKVDEGETTTTSQEEGEYHILTEEVQGTDGNTSSSSDPQTAAPDEKDNPDSAVTSSDENNTPTGEVNPDDASDLAAYDTVKALAESSNSTERNSNNQIILYSVGSGVIGMTIGAGLVYFLTKKH